MSMDSRAYKLIQRLYGVVVRRCRLLNRRAEFGVLSNPRPKAMAAVGLEL